MYGAGLDRNLSKGWTASTYNTTTIGGASIAG
eukprot:SAG25_NODE_9878_length_354_cov_1.019608_1_plen_31_part_01